MLGPLEESLADAGQLPPRERERVQVVHRNGLRLLKLVNSLLDFSRIEAGRTQASFEPTDLGEFTAELASNFRSATEKAGLGLIIDCPPLPMPVYVDRDMWEKIVLNLLSNAFKFTFAGSIKLDVRRVKRAAVLTVRDTGTGIPQAELPRLFERFHRIAGARGRSHEGSGIGLALVQELVKLHGGSIQVESQEGRGTAFIVSIPIGSEHLPQEFVRGERALASTAVRAQTYIGEALRWLPDAGSFEEESEQTNGGLLTGLPALEDAEQGRVLLADDNADMRDYVCRLLEAAGWNVEVVEDGEAALEAARRERPELVLSDIMMPRLDGFGLLRALRADSELKTVPVILLSARAGEEAEVEGIEAGADDYLVKPFSARELLARVQSNIALARVRCEATERERELRLEAEALRSRFETVIQNLPVGAGLFDQDGRVTLTQRLLAFSRRQPLDPKPVDVNKLVSTMSDLLGRTLGEGVEIQTVLAGGLWRVEADPNQLESALLNLAVNARDAMPEGGRLTVETANAHLDEAYAAKEAEVLPGQYVVLCVSDTGGGMSKEVLARVFEPFFTTKPTGHGTGLGLSQVYGFVKQSGGHEKSTASRERGLPSESTSPGSWVQDQTKTYSAQPCRMGIMKKRCLSWKMMTVCANTVRTSCGSSAIA